MTEIIKITYPKSGEPVMIACKDCIYCTIMEPLSPGDGDTYWYCSHFEERIDGDVEAVENCDDGIFRGHLKKKGGEKTMRFCPDCARHWERVSTILVSYSLPNFQYFKGKYDPQICPKCALNKIPQKTAETILPEILKILTKYLHFQVDYKGTCPIDIHEIRLSMEKKEEGSQFLAELKKYFSTEG
jgi:hypothetical protein